MKENLGNRDYLPRTMSELEKAEFRLDWSREHGYPGTIPRDIEEYVDSKGYRTQICIFAKA
jgi:hypothetical protein